MNIAAAVDASGNLRDLGKSYPVMNEISLLESLASRSSAGNIAGFQRFQCAKKITIARHKCCDVYCGARETVGGSSVSSGCWGEDSNHANG